MNITDKTGKLVTIKSVTDDNDLMIINKSGITIRLKVADVRIMGACYPGCSSKSILKRETMRSVQYVRLHQKVWKMKFLLMMKILRFRLTINEVEGEEKDYNSDNEVNNKDEE